MRNGCILRIRVEGGRVLGGDGEGTANIEVDAGLGDEDAVGDNDGSTDNIGVNETSAGGGRGNGTLVIEGELTVADAYELSLEFESESNGATASSEASCLGGKDGGPGCVRIIVASSLDSTSVSKSVSVSNSETESEEVETEADTEDINRRWVVRCDSAGAWA